MKRILLSLTFAALAATLGTAAVAESYTVTLDNGSSFETRYQPIEDPSDPTKLLLLTDQSNWIALPVAIVAGVTEQLDSRGYGLRIDSRTVEVGFLPNDLPDASEEGTAETPDPMQQVMRALQGEPDEPYTVNQFVQPEEAGGIPIGFTRRLTPPLGRPGEVE